MKMRSITIKPTNPRPPKKPQPEVGMKFKEEPKEKKTSVPNKNA